MHPITSEYLDYDEVSWKNMIQMMEWLAGLYINTLNVIHYMHDKYSYERIEMALHDTENRSYNGSWYCWTYLLLLTHLSAIKYAKVKVIRDENGLAVRF